jgi:hypothetical protein
MRIARLLMLGIVTALIAAPAATSATETVTTVERIPFDIEAFSECTGEDIDVEGTLVVVSHITTTTDDQGNIVSTQQHLTLAASNVQGTTAAGEMVRFVFTDVFQFNFTNGAETSLSNLNQQIVAQGPDNNSFLDFTFHGTFTPNGQFTGFVGNVRVGCR